MALCCAFAMSGRRWLPAVSLPRLPVTMPGSDRQSRPLARPCRRPSQPQRGPSWASERAREGLEPARQAPGGAAGNGASLFLREIGYREIVDHPSDDDLERYAIRTMPDSEIGQLEEHLLICPECRARLDETEQYVTAIRAAAVEIGG